MKKKNSFKKVMAGVLALTLVVTSLGAGISAYFTGTDKKSDTYTIGQIEVELVGEDNLYSAEKLTPNYEYEFTRSVHNIGINDAYVFMAVTLPYDTIYTHDLAGDLNVLLPLDTQLFTYGTEGVAGVSPEWKLVTEGQFGDYDIQDIEGAVENLSDTHGAVRENKTITYVYGYVGDNVDVLARLAADEETSSLFDTVKFTNISDADKKFNIEATDGKIVTQVFAIQADNVLETEYMTGNNADGSEMINAVWSVLNTATNDKSLSAKDLVEREEEEKEEKEEEDEGEFNPDETGTISFSLINSDTDKGVQNVNMTLVKIGEVSTYAMRGGFANRNIVVDTMISDENGYGIFEDLEPGVYALTSNNFELTEDASYLVVSKEDMDVEYVYYDGMGWAATIDGKVIDDNGKGVKEATVSVVDGNGDVVIETATNNSGNYSAYPLLEGDYTVEVDSYTTIEPEKVFATANNSTSVNFTEKIENVLLCEYQMMNKIGNKSKITSVTFTNTAVPDGVTTIDVSEKGNRSVLAYFVGTDVYVTSADGGPIYAHRWSQAMFQSCSKLERVDFSNLNTSNMLYTTGMFAYCSKLTEINWGTFNTPSAKHMATMFVGCTSLTSLDLSFMDVKKAEDMTGMFQGCSNLKELNVSGWSVPNLKEASSMFNGCKNIEVLDLTNWSMSSIEQVDNMFYGCTNLTSIGDVSDWNTKNMKDMSYMFSGCANLKNVDVGRWNVSKVNNMSHAFSGCKTITELDVAHWDTASVEKIDYLFSNCSSLTTLDLSVWDVSSATAVGGMFNGCANLTTIHGADWREMIGDELTKNTLFQNCTSLNGAIPFDSTKKSAEYANFESGYFTAKHDYNEWKIVEPTCVKNGYKYLDCGDCNLKIHFVVPALGHDFIDGICSRCSRVRAYNFTSIEHGEYHFEEKDGVWTAKFPSMEDDYGVSGGTVLTTWSILTTGDVVVEWRLPSEITSADFSINLNGNVILDIYDLRGMECSSDGYAGSFIIPAGTHELSIEIVDNYDNLSHCNDNATITFVEAE